MLIIGDYTDMKESNDTWYLFNTAKIVLAIGT